MRPFALRIALLAAFFLSTATTSKADLYSEYSLTLLQVNPQTDEVDNELWASAELLVGGTAGKLDWYIYLDANRRPDKNGSANRLGVVSGDHYTALDSDGSSRVIVAEAMLGGKISQHWRLDVGLYSPGSFLDSSSVANDETSDFVALPFYGNTAFGYPLYAPGLLLGWSKGDQSLLLSVTSSNGIHDNPDASYSELLDVTGDGKGIFAAIEWTRTTSKQQALRLGAWVNSRDNDRLDRPNSTADNWGVYVNADSQTGLWNWNARLGFANPKVSATLFHLSLAATRPLSVGKLGFAVSLTPASPKLNAEHDNSGLVELHWRWSPRSWVQLTPFAQFAYQTGYGTDPTIDRNLWVFGLRSSIEFGYSEKQWSGLFVSR